MRAYFPLLSTSLLWQGVPFFQTSPKPTPLPNLSALSLQRDVPTLKPLDVRATLPLLYISLQGLGVPHFIPSSVHAYATLLW